MNRWIAATAAVLINVAVAGVLNWNVQRHATPAGSVEVVDLNAVRGDEVLVAAAPQP